MSFRDSVIILENINAWVGKINLISGSVILFIELVYYFYTAQN